MMRVRRVASILALCVLCHVLTVGYGYRIEVKQIGYPRVPGDMGGTIVVSRHIELAWTDLNSGSMIAWSRGMGYTCDIISTVRSPDVYIDTIVRQLSDASKPPAWSVAQSLMEDASSPYDVVEEAAYGFPIRFVFQRQAFSHGSTFVLIPLPGDSDPAPRWDISYGRLLASILLYLGPIWLVYGLYPSVRRYLRRRRGCCGECAYSLKGLNTTTCPECGHVNEASKARTLSRS